MDTTRIRLNPGSGAGDGYRGNLRLLREVEGPIVVDARALGPCHPMFLVRLRLFVDWHRGLGHEVSIIPPTDPAIARALEVLDGTDSEAPREGQLRLPNRDPGRLALRRLTSDDDVEDAASEALDLLHEQVPALAVWGEAMHMALGELCDNAAQHGRNDLGTYVAADRVDRPQPTFRLAVADLGIGIPEHIRTRHPEWHDDSAAIGRALAAGVTGTADPQRGNGFPEVLDAALHAHLVRTASAAGIDIRSGKGRVVAEFIHGQMRADQAAISGPRRGTWITYSVISAGGGAGVRSRG